MILKAFGKINFSVHAFIHILSFTSANLMTHSHSHAVTEYSPFPVNF